MSIHDKIVKLVFIRIDGQEGPRKTVVPLVEGCDFDQFLSRLRRRLGIREDVAVSLNDAASGPVDSIDRLLEVDESATLDVHAPDAVLPSPVPATPSGMRPSASTPSSRGAASQRAPHSVAGGGSSGGAAPSIRECRVDVPTSEWTRAGDREGDESGALKYRKRRRDFVSLARSCYGVIALVILGGLALGAMHALS